MPEPQKDLYAAACNPPRRAKRTNIPIVDPVTTISSSPSTSTASESFSSALSHQHRPILPMRPYAPRDSAQSSIPGTGSGASSDPVAPPPPAKRGRKPGPLSRTAREAQRRLNHSIIEKARRTKINDALATLKQLVPPNYVSGLMKQQLQQNSSAGRPSAREDEDEDEEDDDDDDEYDDGKKKQQQKAKAKQNGKGTGKKEEKEKEFKLEILVRTVAFLQDLLEKVNSLDAVPSSTATSLPPPAPVAPSSPQVSCPQCGAEYGRPTKEDQPSNWRKRKHIETLDDSDDQPEERNLGCDPEKPVASGRPAKIPRRYNHGPGSGADEERVFDRAPDMDVVSRKKTFVEGPHRALHKDARPHSHTSSSPKERLPPISSWLHNDRVPSPPSASPTAGITNSMIDPQLLPPSNSNSSSELVKPSRSRTHSNSGAYLQAHPHLSPSPSYLPSPPGSTHFDPVRSSAAGIPPLLSLGPVSTGAMVNVNVIMNGEPLSNQRSSSRSKSKESSSTSPEIRASPPSFVSNGGSGGDRWSSYAGNGNSSSSAPVKSRTPEDESAASLLLQIASSPTFRPVPETGSSSTSSSPVFRGVSAGSSSSGKRIIEREQRHEHGHERDPSVLMLSSSDVRSSRVHEQGQQQHRDRDRGRPQHDQQHHQQQAQTPSSLLGLNLGIVNGRRY